MKTAIWPSRDDYQIVVRQPQRHLKDSRLHRTQVETRALGMPFPRSGNFGAVYKFSKSQEAYALKVFDKVQKDRQLRYKLIDEHLKRQPSSANLLSFSYDDEGILVNGFGRRQKIVDVNAVLADDGLRTRHELLDNLLFAPGGGDTA